MLRVTEAQARLFGIAAPAKKCVRPPQAQKRKDALPENVVEAQCLAYLRHRGWIVCRQHVGTYIPYYAFKQYVESHRPVAGSMVRIGTKGQADWRCERPLRKGSGAYECFEMELKAPGEKPKPDQLKYMYERNALGFIAVWFDGLNPLIAWYAERFDA